MASLDGSSSGSPEDSSGQENSSPPEGESEPDTEEDREDHGSHWDLYKALNSALLSNANVEGEPATVEKRAESLKKDFSELKGQHARLVQHIQKVKSNRKSLIRESLTSVSEDIPDTDLATVRLEGGSQLLKEIASIQRELREKNGEIARLTLENETLVKSHDDLEKQLTMSQHDFSRLERERKVEVTRLKANLGEEKLGRHKEKQALEEDVTQLRGKLQESRMKLEEEVRSGEQCKADLNISQELCTSSQKDAMELREECNSHRNNLALLLGVLRAATIQISSLSEQVGSPRSSRIGSHKQETSEYEAAVKDMEEKLQVHCEQWEAMRASIIQKTSEIAGLKEGKKKLERDIHTKIKEVCERDARLSEVRELCSSGEANQERLKMALADFQGRVQSLGQESEKAKMECQKLRSKNEILEKDLENEQTTKSVVERLHQEKILRLETRLSEEVKKKGSVESDLEEEKRQTQALELKLDKERRKVGSLEMQLREEKREVKLLETQLSDEKRSNVDLAAKMENKENDFQKSQQNLEENLRAKVRSLTNRNKSLQEECKELTNLLMKASKEDKEKMDSLVEVRLRAERDNSMKSLSFESSFSPYPSSSNLSFIRGQEQRSFRHHHSSSPIVHGSSNSLHSSHLESRSSTTVLTRDRQLQNSGEFLLNGALQGSMHSVSQEVSSTESEKDSQSQFPASSAHSMEPGRKSASLSPANTHSPSANSSSSTSDVN